HRAGGIAQETPDSHGEHARFRLQQPARTTAASLDEIFDGVTARHDGGEVLHEDDGVQGVATKTAAYDKRPALAQEAADEREIEVDTGSNVGNGKAIHIDDIRQQQVVHVAAVARDVDDLVVFRGTLQRLHVPEFDTVVQPIPKPRQG